MTLLNSPLFKGENTEWLVLVKEENTVCVRLAKLDLHFAEFPSLYDSEHESGNPEINQTWIVDM